MKVTKIVLDNSRMVSVMIGLIVLLGVMVYSDFPSREDPLVRISRAMIVTQFPGMPPEQVEMLITKKIEEKLREIGEIEYVKSTSQAGQSIISVSVFEDVPDYEKIWDEVRRKIEGVKSVLPQGVVGPVMNDGYGDVAIVTAALTGRGWDMAELRQHARRIRDQIYTVDGVRRVSLNGVQQEKVYLEARPSLIEAQGVDVGSVVQAVQDRNRILPSGSIVTKLREINIETSGKLESLDDLSAMEISTSDYEGVLSLVDYFSIRRTFSEPPVQLAYFNGEPAIIVSASMQPGRNILEIGPRLKKLLKDIDKKLPVGMRLQIATFQPEVVDKAISNVKGSLYQTLLIVLAVVILALGLYEGLIVGVTVPLTILATLLVMYLIEIDLQFISLASLIIALGMLVDNGIVIVENIHLRLHQGESRRNSAVSACQELALPLLTSTLTTVLAFAPILLANNTSGEYTRSLAQVVSISLLVSWILSLTVVPLLAVRFIPDKMLERSFVLLPYYRIFLVWVLKRSKLFLSIIVGVFLSSLAVVSLVPVEMFAVSSRSEVLVYLDLPAGYNSYQTEEASLILSDWLLDETSNTNVNYVTTYVGSGGPRFFLSITPRDPAPHRGFMVVEANSPENARKLQGNIREFVDKNIPQARVRAELIARGTVPPGVVQLRFVGPNSETLFNIARQAEAELSSIPGAIHVYNDWENRTKRYRVSIDEARVRRAGVTFESISHALKGTISGAQITQIRRDDGLIPVVVKVKSNEIYDVNGDNLLDSVKIYTKEGDYVLLSQVASIETVAQFGSIARRNMERTVTVSGKHLRMKAPELQSAWDEKIQHIYDNLPDGYRVELGGELEGFQDSAGTLFLTMPLFIGLILGVLVSQFNSFRKAAIVTLSIPLAFSGGFLGLYITGANFDFIGALGFLSLAGIIINNAIVLIDKITVEQVNGKSKREAIFEAAMNRFRPILITTITTVLAIIPLMMMEETLFYSMASVIIFGLAIGTLMTLGAVPALCLLFLPVTNVESLKDKSKPNTACSG
jgi:multidrug efflux pump